MSSLTSSLEVERSLDSCTLAVHRPLAYFRSANVKTFCKIHNKSSFIRALNRLFRLVLQYILRWLISLQMNYRRQNEIFGIGIYFQAGSLIFQNMKKEKPWVSVSTGFYNLLLFNLVSIIEMGHIGVKVNGCLVAQNMVRRTNFFCGLCLMSLKSVSVKLWRSSKAI